MAEKNVVREAVIDLGTNTFNLLIAQIDNGQLIRIYSDKLPVLLGMGGINKGVITDSAMLRAKNALILFHESCKKYKVVGINGIGTSALRAASNSSELIDFARIELGIPIEVISGNREAELIYHGVRLSNAISNPCVIMDIGGGSTEFIGASSTGINWTKSFDIGVSRIFQQLGKPEEFKSEHIQSILNFLNTESKGYFDDLHSKKLIGASGSFETLYEMVFKCAFPQHGNAVDVPFNSLIQALEWGVSSTLEERMNNEWIVPIRKKMLPIAAVKVKWVIEKLGIEEVSISPYSLKEGVFSKEI